jgi:hypothetical protein
MRIIECVPYVVVGLGYHQMPELWEAETTFLSHQLVDCMTGGRLRRDLQELRKSAGDLPVIERCIKEGLPALWWMSPALSCID